MLVRPRSGALAKHDTIETYFDNVLGTKEICLSALSMFAQFCSFLLRSLLKLNLLFLAGVQEEISAVG